MQRQDGGKHKTGQKPSFRVESPGKITVGLGTPPQRVYTQNVTLHAPFWTTVREEDDGGSLKLCWFSTGAQWPLMTPRIRTPDCGPGGRQSQHCCYTDCFQCPCMGVRRHVFPT